MPVVFWGIVNRGGEQAAQHSQALHALFAHIPGLKVVMPSAPCDAKGLMMAAIRDLNPVVFVDDRWLYGLEGEVPIGECALQIGEGVVRKKGRDVSIVCYSYMVVEALRAADMLLCQGIEAEIIDLRSVKPFDGGIILESIQKTGRLVIADGGWKTCGFGAEIAAFACENGFDLLEQPVKRVALPDAPAPASRTLEKAYYPDAHAIVNAVRELTRGKEREAVTVCGV